MHGHLTGLQPLSYKCLDVLFSLLIVISAQFYPQKRVSLYANVIPVMRLAVYIINLIRLLGSQFYLCGSAYIIQLPVFILFVLNLLYLAQYVSYYSKPNLLLFSFFVDHTPTLNQYKVLSASCSCVLTDTPGWIQIPELTPIQSLSLRKYLSNNVKVVF